MQPNRLLEALQCSLALIPKVEALASGELFHDIGNEYLTWLGLVTDPCG